MTALLLQTLLLMIPAFFVGAALACGLRRWMNADQPARAAVPPLTTTAAPVEPLTQYAGRPAVPTPAAAAAVTPRAALEARPSTPATVQATAAVSRFDDALKARTVEPPRPAPPGPVTAPVQAAMPVPEVASAKLAEPARVAAPPPPPPPAPPKAALPPTPVVAATPAPVSVQAAPATSAMIASAAAAAAAAAAVVASQARAALAPALMPTGVPADIPIAAPAPAVAVPPVERQVEALVPAATPSVLPAAQVRPITGSPDDLTRISVIDGGMAGQLQKLNVTQFSQIAAWRKSDVAAMSGALGFQGRIEQENWIEQAQILANGGETYYSARRARAPSTVTMAAPASAPAAPVVLPMPDASAATAPRVAERSAFAEAPAALRPATMPTPAAVVEPIKAAIVATTAPVVAAVAAALATPAVAATPSEPTIPEAQATASPLRPTMAPQRDNLQRIGGINAEIEKLLAVQGITRFNQVSSWGTTDVERFDRLLGSQGRITRENWVEQAQILGKGGDTAHSRDFDRRSTEMPRDAAARPKSITEAIKANTGAAPSRPDITGLRSVRSDAYRQPALDANTAAAAAAAAGAGSAKVVRSAEIDDLKRIRGIGVLIEKRLNSVGIVSYGQIAEWTNEDIDRVSASLDFKGRIERENWVEQARILASGGQTEFSRRVDRGEVETSKAKS